jgi:hypothetical protein
VSIAEKEANDDSSTVGSECYNDAMESIPPEETRRVTGTSTGPAQLSRHSLPIIVEEQVEPVYANITGAGAVSCQSASTGNSSELDIIVHRNCDFDEDGEKEDEQLVAAGSAADCVPLDSADQAESGMITMRPAEEVAITGVSLSSPNTGTPHRSQMPNMVPDYCGELSSSIIPGGWFSTPLSSHIPPPLLTVDNVAALTLRRSEVPVFYKFLDVDTSVAHPDPG